MKSPKPAAHGFPRSISESTAARDSRVGIPRSASDQSVPRMSTLSAKRSISDFNISASAVPVMLAPNALNMIPPARESTFGGLGINTSSFGDSQQQVLTSALNQRRQPTTEPVRSSVHTRNPSDSSSTYVKALYDFESENAGEMSIRTGDLIKITNEIDAGWWEVHARNTGSD
jgi:SH3 domain